MARGEEVRLRIALGEHGCVEALRAGEAQAPGLQLDFVPVSPMIGAYRRMIRELEFDVCELAPTTYVIAREAGIPITALPIFLMRRFHHGDLQCRVGSGIRQPKDLEGREVGVRAYSVTTGMWVRGFLQHQYDVKLESVRWLVDDDEHVETLSVPPNVRRLPDGDSVADMFQSGRMDAALTGNAGTGRSGPPTAEWERGRAESGSAGYPLIADAERVASDWYRQTRVYPLHALVCVKRSLLDDQPWIAESLSQAFAESKCHFLHQLEQAPSPADSNGGVTGRQHYRRMTAVVGEDPLPFGVEPNEAGLHALVRFSREQGLLANSHEPADLFWS